MQTTSLGNAATAHPPPPKPCLHALFTLASLGCQPVISAPQTAPSIAASKRLTHLLPKEGGGGAGTELAAAQPQVLALPVIAEGSESVASPAGPDGMFVGIHAALGSQSKAHFSPPLWKLAWMRLFQFMGVHELS